jgi:hypothetical protein
LGKDEFNKYVQNVPKKRDPDGKGGYRFVGEVKFTLGTKEVPQVSNLKEDEIRIYAPDPLAERRVALSGEQHLVVGSAIETFIHSKVNTTATLSAMGWDPSQVAIKDTGMTVDPAPILARLASGLMPLSPNETNDDKYVLTSAPPPLKDDEQNLKLSFGRTDYQTHRTVRSSPDGIENDDSLALEFGNLDVELNRVPSSAGLHFIVRLLDDTVLLLRRRKDILHEKSKWSISGEEQFKNHDFWDNTLLRVFQRSFCEEVVPLYDKSPETLQYRWDTYVADKIETMRLWGLLFEEHACVTSLLGFYQLRISRKEFVAWRRDLVKHCVGTIDKEGTMHWTTTTELERLLATGSCNAWMLERPESFIIEDSMLHKTSRYRAFRLIRAVRSRLPSINAS